GRSIALVEGDVDHPIGETGGDVEAAAFYAGEVLGRRVLDEVDVACEQRRDPRALVGERSHDDPLPGWRVAPVVGVAVEHDLLAAGEVRELIGPRAYREVGAVELG